LSHLNHRLPGVRLQILRFAIYAEYSIWEICIYLHESLQFVQSFPNLDFKILHWGKNAIVSRVTEK
jgi:hypothetical protein